MPELSTLKQFVDFINHRCQILEATRANAAIAKSGSRLSAVGNRQTASVATVKAKCGYCRGEHSIYHCKDFLALAVPKRIVEIRKNKICANCLRSTTHGSSKCTSGNCKICHLRHNTLPHLAAAVPEPPNNGPPDGTASTSTSAPSVSATSSISACDNQGVMLSTALVYAYDVNGSRVPCRVLLDSGSQANFMSKRFFENLGIESRVLNVSITGINSVATRATRVAQVQLQSRIDSFRSTIDCIVADQVTDKLPAFTLRRRDFEIPQNIKLAILNSMCQQT